MMDNPKRWRICTSLVALVSFNADKVYLADLSDPTGLALLRKNVSVGLGMLEIPINFAEFEIKIERVIAPVLGENGLKRTTKLIVLIKNEEFPKPDCWYYLENFSEDHLPRILTKSSINNGLFSDKFTAIISPSLDYSGKISLVSESMREDYETYYNEMLLQTVLEGAKKTKKIVPGNKYFSDDEVIIPLLKVKRWLDTDSAEDCWLYVNCIGDHKTISSILTNYGLNTHPICIKLQSKLGAMIDGGKVLENDSDKLSNDEYIYHILHNTNLEVWENFLTFGNNLEDFFKILQLFENRDYTINNIEIFGIIQKVINNAISLIMSDRRQPSTEQQTIDYVWSNICIFARRDISNLNRLILEKLNVNAKDDLIAGEVRKYFSEDFLSSFENYINYFKNPSGNVVIDTVTKDARKEFEKLGGENLISLVNNIIEGAISNNWQGNFSARVEPINNYCAIKITITLQDIINYFGNIEKVPQCLKREIMDSRINGITVLLKSDAKILKV